MREIKFRLWCKDKNEWEKDLWWIGCDGNLYTVIKGQLRGMKKETHLLSQFTGLHDSKGVEIYEGDIIKGKEGNYPVSWDQESGRWGAISGMIMVFPECFGLCEVVGNIFNPYLLEVKNDKKEIPHQKNG